ncbi:MAG: hypothetical protein H0T53_04780 [Herpetosiphonaceae bacterium]|nr:hypothetical protein [Herpetosiphonaceae bacterium]
MKRPHLILIAIVASALIGIGISAWGYDPTYKLLEVPHQFERQIVFNQQGMLAITGKETTALWDWQHDAIQNFAIASTSLAWSADSQTLALGANSDTVTLIRPSDGTRIQTIENYGNANTTLAWSYDHQFLAGQEWQDGILTVWQLTDPTHPRSHIAGRGIDHFAWHPLQHRIVYEARVNEEISIIEWDLATNTTENIITSEMAISFIAWSDDGSTIILAGAWKFDTGVIEFWTNDQGFWTLRNRIEAPHRPLITIAVNDSGTRIAGVDARGDTQQDSRDNTIIVWDTATGTIVNTFRGHADSVTSMDFSPDGQLLASASWDRTVRL